MTIKRLRIFEWQQLGDLADCFGVSYPAMLDRVRHDAPLFGYEIESRPVEDADGAGHRTTHMYRARRLEE